MFQGVAVMEDPLRDRTSTASSTIIRGPESDSAFHDLDAVHHIPIHDGSPAYDLADDTPFGVTRHSMMKSPGSMAQTLATVASTNKQQYRVLGTFSLVAILYLSSCGGPVSSEPLFSTGGPLVGLLVITCYVLFCQIPIALMITELCCAFPENGGYAVWTMTAFGPFMGFQVGYWSWVASVINNSIYPGFIYSAVTTAIGVEANSNVVVYFIKVAIALLLALPSFIGVRFVGSAARVALSFILGITLLFSIWGLAKGKHEWFRLTEVRNGPNDGRIDWSLLIHTTFWSFDGLHWISMIGGEVRNPARTYPRVLGFTAMLTALSYLAPGIVSISANLIPWRDMVEDSYPTVAHAFGGVGLDKLVLVASLLSLGGLFSCTMFLQSFLIQGMAQSQLLPGILRRRNKRSQMPQYALLVGLSATIVLSAFQFETMLNMANTFSCSVQVMIVLTMLRLRHSFPYLPRPMRIPGNIVTLAIMLVPPLCVFGYAIITTLQSWEKALVIIAFAIPGLLFPRLRQWLAGVRVWCC